MVQNVGSLRKRILEELNPLKCGAIEELLRVSWTEKKSNEWVIREMKCKTCFMPSINKGKLSFFGHICRHDNVDGELLLGSVVGKRAQYRPKTCYCDNIAKLCYG